MFSDSTYIYLLGCSHHTFCMGRNYFANYFDFKQIISLGYKTYTTNPNKLI